MMSLQQLEKEALDRRAQFNATLHAFQSRLTPDGLAKEALLHLDPHLSRVQPAFLAVKRHPILAAGALVGVSWLLKQALSPKRRGYKNGSTPQSSHPRIPQANPKTLTKETIHEND
jgi:hypothetical protein